MIKITDRKQAEKFGLIKKPDATAQVAQKPAENQVDYSPQIRELKGQVERLGIAIKELKVEEKRIDVIAMVERDKDGKMTAIKITGS